MKNSLLKYLSILSCAGVLFVSATGCKDDDETPNPKLPDATQEGKGTFGCLVDGKLWFPYNPDASSLNPSDYTVRTNTFPVNASVLTVDVKNLNGNNAGVSHMTLAIRSASAIAPGVYTLSNGFNALATLGANRFSTDVSGSGRMTITKVEPYSRTVNGITTNRSIVSGTFEFTAGGSGPTSGQALTVTEGRFDLTPLQTL